ncbi:MAG: Peptidoglycan-associated protein [Verrucomicrobiales bacterium]|nr:Peptidoglycan-associated protein [Verrucomicrobiales bacterium]
MRFPLMLPAVLAATLLGGTGCGFFKDPSEEGGEDSVLMNGTPRRAELPAYNGSRVQRGKMPGIEFSDTAWEVSITEKEKIKAVATYLKVNAERVILAGGASVPNAEYARQLGQQRALSVKNALMREGIPGTKIITVSFGTDLPGPGGDRVEFGFVHTGGTGDADR